MSQLKVAHFETIAFPILLIIFPHSLLEWESLSFVLGFEMLPHLLLECERLIY